ncbi:MAG: transmembrane domain-containing protein [bacterium]|nr:transmembrane domain-containing protein [bacterium]
MRRMSQVLLMAVMATALFAAATAVAAPRFNDVAEDHLFYSDIEWLADAGITAGCNPPTNTNFCPESNVTRGQMAAFLVRALDLTATGTTDFADDNTSIFEDDINKLATAGITAGCNPPTNTNFCPESNVTRGQMAAFLQRGMAANRQLWSDPATWGGQLPAAGDNVAIDAGTTIVLDVSPPPLGEVQIRGELIFDDRDLNLTADAIVVRGRLTVGTASRPYTDTAAITLTGTNPALDVGAGMGTKVLGIGPGGTLDLHGTPETASWTRLGATAAAGATSITLAESVSWSTGDQIVVASTDYDFEEAEVRTVVSVAGAVVTLDEPLDHLHWGQAQTYGGSTVDERAEVGLLTHNILIRGDATSSASRFGGHVMMMAGSTGRISNVEFEHMGQAGLMGRYPVHFHMAGDMTGSYVRSSSIHDSFQRCVTVHGTHNALVQDNVGHEILGHCYFLEDGNETRNTFDHNLGLSIRKPDESEALLASDFTSQGPSVFWITNPDNTFTDNSAAGSDGTGFWVALPEHPTGLSATDDIWPRRTPLGTFSGNTTHSNRRDGLHVDNGPRDDGTTETTSYHPRVNPQDENSDPVTAVFADLTTYKNRTRGIWLRGRDHVVTGAAIADNLIGATFASNESYLEDSVVVGETANHDGNPPRTNDPSFPIRGFEFYDGKVGVRDTYFAEFVPDGDRGAGALSQLRFTAFHVSPANSAEGVSFASGTNRVWLETRSVPTDPDNGEDGYRSTVILDVDGSVTGTAGDYVVVDNPFLLTGSCSQRTAWGAWVCPNYYVDLLVQNRDSSPGSIGPVVVTRDDGPAHTIVGTPGSNTNFYTSAIEDRSYDVAFTGTAPSHVRLRMLYVTPGDSVIVSLPMSGADVYRDYYVAAGQELPEFGSLAALEASTGDGVYSDGASIHVKLYVSSDRDYAVLDLCTSGCT